MSESNSASVASNQDFKIAIIIVGVFVMLLLLTAAFCYFTIFQRISPPKFCTTEDEIFQIIVAKKDKWIEQFRIMNGYPVLRFSTSDGREYVVNADRWNIPSEPPQFYVQVTELRNEPYGLYGYLYQATDILDRRYKTTFLADGIYCYQLY